MTIRIIDNTNEARVEYARHEEEQHRHIYITGDLELEQCHVQALLAGKALSWEMDGDGIYITFISLVETGKEAMKGDMMSKKETYTVPYSCPNCGKHFSTEFANGNLAPIRLETRCMICGCQVTAIKAILPLLA